MARKARKVRRVVPPVGRPAYRPEPAIRQLVEIMAMAAMSQEAMCRELVARGQPCAAVETLVSIFPNELAYGKERRMTGYVVKLHTIAMGNSGSALGAVKYILSTQGGDQWRQKLHDPDIPQTGGNRTTIVIHGGTAEVTEINAGDPAAELSDDLDD
jgi:hypothetical protein